MKWSWKIRKMKKRLLLNVGIMRSKEKEFVKSTTICDEKEEEFVKSTRKQGMNLCIRIINVFLNKYKNLDSDGANWALLKALAFVSCPRPPTHFPFIKDIGILSASEIDPKIFSL